MTWPSSATARRIRATGVNDGRGIDHAVADSGAGFTRVAKWDAARVTAMFVVGGSPGVGYDVA